ncbi:aldehyde dehydrogenase (NADP(+)) [Fodinibius halophilus]|uniref:Aldehyde dehydrogenase (NADP(+)) n=1 Tax=Fodinibius halophilus TaxID=1736908 RepID=A0A6M1TGH2_9BACT|nr:aldehyde dehydrogenase (NADP(+)) [Fodinibius halophilus]NGP89202.1 aldehyde dehydrogenase (NADP(+)) [Fodinibius halophilus]
MVEGVNFIGKTTSCEGAQTFRAYDPQKNKELSEQFSIATRQEVGQSLQKAQEAFLAYRHVSGHRKADFLDQIAEEIMGLGNELVERASAESGLPTGRIEGERGRACNQLKMFADLLREGSWVDARIDKGEPDVRRMLVPLGPVVVFGASNFPLAFSTAGGDTASALAAGCPVVVKGHESHPGTNELVSGAIIKAAQKTEMPDGVFSSLNGGPEVGGDLVRHPLTKAVGFTGSFSGGKAIFDMAQQRDEPIPVYAEMGSVNPVFLLDDKLAASAEELAEQYAGSVNLGVGQFCTNPGLIIAKEGSDLDTFKKVLAEKLNDNPTGCMLSPKISKSYKQQRTRMFEQSGIEVVAAPEEESQTRGAGAVAATTAEYFISNEKLGEEVFGPFTLVVSCSDDAQMHQVANSLEGQLTVTFMGEDEELADRKLLIDTCREKAGRIIFNGVPTGVRVCQAMHHGGPFPATIDSKFTSVGTTAIERFVRPVAFQDCPEILLPDELKDDNPLGIHRIVDGNLTR